MAALLVVAVVAVAVAPVSAKRCVFLHGAGQDPSTVGPPTATDTDKYWGGDDIMKYLPSSCTETVFNHDDTVTLRFDSDTLMDNYCNVASDGSGTITDSIVFTHSMGNNIFAAALRAGRCKIDHSTSDWYSASSPGAGSKAANWVDHICANNATNGEALRELADLLHYCQKDDPRLPNEAYVSLKTSYPGLEGLKETLKQETSGAMCGTSDWGLTSKYSILFEALSKLVGYGEDNDGMVGIDSCLLDGVTYGDSPDSDFYQASINHADGTCRDGNGDFGNSKRQPCEWFKART